KTRFIGERHNAPTKDRVVSCTKHLDARRSRVDCDEVSTFDSLECLVHPVDLTPAETRRLVNNYPRRTGARLALIGSQDALHQSSCRIGREMRFALRLPFETVASQDQPLPLRS